MKSVQLQIKELLEDGVTVYSSAAGRVGRVMAVDSNWVSICPYERPWKRVTSHRHTHGATTFRLGDKVKLVGHRDQQGHYDYWTVYNTGLNLK